VAILNLRVDPAVLVGVVLLVSSLGYCFGGANSAKGVRMSIQRVVPDPIPLLILLGLILLAVWTWRRFRGR
jgi:hypothetical protein